MLPFAWQWRPELRGEGARTDRAQRADEGALTKVDPRMPRRIPWLKVELEDGHTKRDRAEVPLAERLVQRVNQVVGSARRGDCSEL